MDNYEIKEKVDGKEAKLSLTQQEVDSAYYVCEGNAVDSVIIMKHHNGGAQFFIDQRVAANCQERHKFEYSFSIKKAALKKEIDSRKKEPKKPTDNK